MAHPVPQSHYALPVSYPHQQRIKSYVLTFPVLSQRYGLVLLACHAFHGDTLIPLVTYLVCISSWTTHNVFYVLSLPILYHVLA